MQILNRAYHWGMAMLSAHPKTCVIVTAAVSFAIGHLV